MLFAALQEGVWRVEGFKFGGWMTVVTSATYCACAAAERAVAGERHRHGSLRDYAALSVLTAGGMWATNASLAYLNYATRVLFKSSKLVPTMIVGRAMQGRRYSGLEYFAAGLLVVGIALFTMGDRAVAPNFHVMGVGLVTVGVFADAATSNFEEANFFRREPAASQAEVVLYSSAIGTLYTLLVTAPTGELGPAVAHSVANPNVMVLLVSSAVSGYVSVSFALLLIKAYGATNTEIVKSLRKVLTVAISFVLYPKPLAWQYGVGGALVAGSLALSHHLKLQKMQQAGGSLRAGM